MSKSINAQPYTGPLTVDATALAGKVVDLPPGTMAHMRTEQPGVDKVLAELVVAVPTLGAAAQEPYSAVLTNTTDLTAIRQRRIAAQKLTEVLVESEARCEHERENALAMLVDLARSAAKRKADPSILAGVETTVKYVTQSAAKAASTRKKNAAAKKTANGGG
jgi:hypothetical protein